MGSKTKETTHEVQSNAPPAWAAPGLAELGGRITSIIPSMPGPMYTGDFVAGENALDAGVAQMYQQAAQTALGLVPMAQNAAEQALVAPTFGGPTTGQGTQSFASYDPTAIAPVVQATLAPLQRQLMQEILPQMSSSSIDSGAYSGSRAMAALPSMALSDFSRNAQEVATGLGFQDFQSQQNRMLEAFGLETARGLGEADVMSNRLGLMPALTDTIMRLSATAPDLAAAGAGYQRSLEQMAIDDAIAKQDYAVRYPFQGLDVAAALLGNLATPWGTRTTDGTRTTSTGGLAPIVGGAIGLGSMIGGFPGIGSIFGAKPPVK